MAKFQRLRQASPNLIVRIFVQDSTAATGAGKTGIVRTQTDLKINLIRELSAAGTNYVGNTSVEDITTLGTYAAPTAANVRFKEIDSTNFPGWYELQLEQFFGGTSDASKFVSGMLRATGAAPCPFEIELAAINIQDSVRVGLTALPNAAADAAGGLPISDAGGLDLDTKLANTNEITVARMGALTDWINGGRLDLIIDIIAADTTTDIPALIVALEAKVDIIDITADAILVDTAEIGAAGVGLTAAATAAIQAIRDRVSPIVTKTGAVVADGGNSATTFVTDLTESTNDYWKDSYLRLTSGALIDQVKKVTGYNGTTKAVTVLGGFTATPANGVTFEIVND